MSPLAFLAVAWGVVIGGPLVAVAIWAFARGGSRVNRRTIRNDRQWE